MNEVEKLQQENKLLQNQVVELQEDLHRQHHVFRQIEDFSSRLGVSIELKDIYRDCLNLFKDLLCLDFATLFLVGDDTESLTIYDTIGFADSLVGQFTVCKGIGLPGLVFESGHVEVVEDFQTEKRISVPGVIFENRITSAIAVPMMHNKQLFGVVVGHTLTKKVFSADEKSLAQTLANQSATAIKNATHIQSLYISEQNYIERTAEFESIFSSSMTGIMLLRGGRILVRCNQRFLEILGYDTLEEVQGQSMRQFHLSEESFLDFGRKYYDKLVSGEPVKVEYQLRKKNGQPLWCSMSGKAIDRTMPPNLKKGVVWVIDDISQRKKMEEKLLMTQKFQSIEILTGGLAHDFNNIITAILGNINLGMASIDQENPAYPFLLPAKEATLRAKELTQKLQHFSKETSPACQLSSLADIITESVSSDPLNDGIVVHYHFENDLWLAAVDFEQIRQALSYLLENSQQAMPDGGEITISCSNFRNNGEITELKSEYYVQVRIEDTGHGIPIGIIDKIFDPYFTTKTRDSKQGSGLGLATVHSIIKRHKGFITVESVENSGAIFTLYLVASPREKELLKEPVIKEEKPSVVSEKGRVLVMDDEKNIRDVIEQMLTLGGYEVELAENGSDAVRLYAEKLDSDKQFDVVVLDLNIPDGMGGADTLQEIRQLHKEARVIASSGDSYDQVMENFEEYGFAGTINKPFDFTELLRTVAAVKANI